MQAKGKAQKMSDTYGHTLSKLLAHYDQNTLSWKMSEDTLALDLAQSLQTLPKSGMTQDGKLYELVMLVRPIKEQESSLLPTPLARDYKGVDGRKEGLEAKLLPTPTAMHVRNHDEPLQAYEQRVMDYKEVDGRKEGLEAKLLPTPTAMHVRNHDEPLQAYEQRVMDYKQGKTKGKPGASTGVAVRLLPTPTTQEGSGMCRDYRSDLTHPMICACKKYQIHWSVVN